MNYEFRVVNSSRGIENSVDTNGMPVAKRMRKRERYDTVSISLMNQTKEHT